MTALVDAMTLSGVGLVHDRFALGELRLGHELPAVGLLGHALGVAVLHPTNLYWENHTAPGRSAGVVTTEDAFKPA